MVAEEADGQNGAWSRSAHWHRRRPVQEARRRRRTTAEPPSRPHLLQEDEADQRRSQ